MKTKEVKNGSLYFNTKTDRVERVISNQFSNTRVVTEHHKREEGSVQAKNLRLATAEEVESYLENKKSVLRRLAETMKILWPATGHLITLTHGFGRGFFNA